MADLLAPGDVVRQRWKIVSRKVENAAIFK